MLYAYLPNDSDVAVNLIENTSVVSIVYLVYSSGPHLHTHAHILTRAYIHNMPRIKLDFIFTVILFLCYCLSRTHFRNTFTHTQDLPTPFCKEARLTYVHMHERVPRTFYFVVSSPGGVAEAQFQINFTLKHKLMSNSIDSSDEELRGPEEIHFPVFGGSCSIFQLTTVSYKFIVLIVPIVRIFRSDII